MHIKIGDLSFRYVLEDFGSFPHRSGVVSLERAVVQTFLLSVENCFTAFFQADLSVCSTVVGESHGWPSQNAFV